MCGKSPVGESSCQRNVLLKKRSVTTLSDVTCASINSRKGDHKVLSWCKLFLITCGNTFRLRGRRLDYQVSQSFFGMKDAMAYRVWTSFPWFGDVFELWPFCSYELSLPGSLRGILLPETFALWNVHFLELSFPGSKLLELLLAGNFIWRLEAYFIGSSVWLVFYNFHSRSESSKKQKKCWLPGTFAAGIESFCEPKV